MVEVEAEKEEKLPLPAAVKNMFESTSQLKEDDPMAHGGKIRSFPHVRGNWASFVYIPCKILRYSMLSKA